MKHPLLSSGMIAIGFILSPLSWWNDLVINVPLSYLISWPFSLLSDALFPVAFILAYWLTNLLGLLMLHWGGHNFLSKSASTFSVRNSLIVSVVYTLVIMVLVWQGWLVSPATLMNYLE